MNDTDTLGVKESEPAAGKALGREVGAGGQPKKVMVLMGSPHKRGATYTASRQFLDRLESFGDVEGEVVALADYHIDMCRGCQVCFASGAEHCPLKDDRDVLLGKMMDADAVVFASPNYSWNVSGLMKVFLDRLGFALHRPRFHGKVATSIVVQGMFRGTKIREYLEFVARGLGFRTVKGSVIRTLMPMSESALKKMDGLLADQARRFHDELLKPAFPSPSIFELAIFRMGRTGIMTSSPRDMRDYSYYRDHGWFESEYFYPTRLGVAKSALGGFFDWTAAHTKMFEVAKSGGGASAPKDAAT